MAAPEPTGMVTTPAVLRSARQQHRRSQRRIAREELARRSIELDRAEAGLPRRRLPRGASQIASEEGMSKLGLQEVAILERSERGRQYVATVAAQRSQGRPPPSPLQLPKSTAKAHDSCALDARPAARCASAQTEVGLTRCPAASHAAG